MKKLISALVVALCAIQVFASGEVQVKVSQTAPRNAYAVKVAVEKKAKLLAIDKYVSGAGYKLDERIADELRAEYATLVTDLDEISCEWEEIGPGEGIMTLEAVVTLDESGIINWLKEHGVTTAMDRVSIVILEEPPSLGAMKLADAFGPGVDGTKFFIQNYTLFQRRIRDEITRNIGEYFDVVLLEDDDVYRKHKKQDMNLLGVYFDPDSNSFVVNDGLLSDIRANQPETIVMYYRLDSLAFDYSTHKILVSVALSFKNLETKATKSIGTREWEERIDTVAQDVIMAKMVACVSSASNSLLKGAGEKLLSMVKGLVNKADHVKQPPKLTVNSGIFEPSVRRKNLFMLKKALKAAGLAEDDQIKSTETTIVATLSSDVQDLDELFYEHLDPIFSELGVELSDEQLHIDSSACTIRITPVEEEE